MINREEAKLALMNFEYTDYDVENMTDEELEKACREIFNTNNQCNNHKDS